MAFYTTRLTWISFRSFICKYLFVVSRSWLGWTTVPRALLSSPFYIAVTSTIVFYFSILLIMYHNLIPRSPSFILALHARIAALKLLCTKSPLSQVFLRIFIASFHFNINVVYYHHYILYRFFSICSSYENFHVQLELFRNVFNRNGYPTRLFDRCLRVFLDKIFQPKKVMYFCLPFTGSYSLQIRTQISRLCSSAFPHLNILRFAFRRTLHLSHLFTFKDKIPKGLRSCVVYHFKCRCCSASYVCGPNGPSFAHTSIWTLRYLCLNR
jgi:hypothetical protein